MKHNRLAVLLFALWATGSRADITHIALVWLAESAPEGTAQVMIEEAALLAQIPGVQDLKAGPPESSERAVVDDSFAVGISLRFKSREALESYLAHPLHVQYVGRYLKPFSSKLQVYDIAH